MSGVYPKLPRAAVRDSFDEEDLSDVDDEVFIRDGKNGILKIDDDCGVKRPLMAPRRKCKAHFSESPQIPYKTLFAPFCYTLIGFAIILGIIILCIMVITRFPMPMNVLKNWLAHNKPKTYDKQNVVPCTSLNSKVQWTRTLPRLTSEAPLRSNDVNGDNVEDIIVGFSTGILLLIFSCLKIAYFYTLKYAINFCEFYFFLAEFTLVFILFCSLSFIR